MSSFVDIILSLPSERFRERVWMASLTKAKGTVFKTWNTLKIGEYFQFLSCSNMTLTEANAGLAAWELGKVSLTKPFGETCRSLEHFGKWNRLSFKKTVPSRQLYFSFTFRNLASFNDNSVEIPTPLRQNHRTTEYFKISKLSEFLARPSKYSRFYLPKLKRVSGA